MHKYFLLMLTFIAGCTGSGSPAASGIAPPETTKVVPRLDDGLDFLSDDLDAGAHVYIGIVIDHKLLSQPGNDDEWGTLTFRVTQTIWGEPRRQLRLPYVMNITANPFGGVCVLWPNFRIDPTPLLVVVIPLGHDCVVGPMPGLDGAATCVTRIRSDDTSIVDAVESICRLHAIKDPNKLRAELAWAATAGLEAPWPYIADGQRDTQQLVRSNAARAIIARYGRTDPYTAVRLLTDQIATVQRARDQEILRLTTYITQLTDPAFHDYPEQDHPATTTKAGLIALLGLLRAPGLPSTEGMDRNDDILHWMGEFLPRCHVDAAQIYDPEARQCLSKTLADIAAAAVAADRHDASLGVIPQLHAWLNKPSAPATQPAGTGH